MLTFPLLPSRWWITRAFGRNPLVRASDRIEAAGIVLAALISLLALPIAATRRPTTPEVPAWCGVGAVPQTNSFESTNRASAGDPLEIWVDDHGNRVDAPPPLSQAGANGAVVGVAIWLAATASAFAGLSWMRWLISRHRDRRWAHELTDLADGYGGEDKHAR